MKIIAPDARILLAYRHAKEQIGIEIRARHEQSLTDASPDNERAIEKKIKREISKELSRRFPFGPFSGWMGVGTIRDDTVE